MFQFKLLGRYLFKGGAFCSPALYAGHKKQTTPETHTRDTRNM